MELKDCVGGTSSPVELPHVDFKSIIRNGTANGHAKAIVAVHTHCDVAFWEIEPSQYLSGNIIRAASGARRAWHLIVRLKVAMTAGRFVQIDHGRNFERDGRG